jgi:hypothetical protein
LPGRDTETTFMLAGAKTPAADDHMLMLLYWIDLGEHRTIYSSKFDCNTGDFGLFPTGCLQTIQILRCLSFIKSAISVLESCQGLPQAKPQIVHLSQVCVLKLLDFNPLPHGLSLATPIISGSDVLTQSQHAPPPIKLRSKRCLQHEQEN